MATTDPGSTAQHPRSARRRRAWRTAALVAGSLVIAGAGFVLSTTWLGPVGGDPGGRARVAYAVPEVVRGYPAPVREAYEFAIERPDVLEWIPCPCGCIYEGHADNRACFVAAFNDDGTVKLDDHGST